jgi:hypothetical protein
MVPLTKTSLKRSLLNGVENRTNQGAVLVWRINSPSLQESIASSAHWGSSLEQAWSIGEEFLIALIYRQEKHFPVG